MKKKKVFSPPRLVLRIRDLVWEKLWALEDATDSEFAAFGLMDLETGIVEDIFVPEQSADGGSTESDADDLLTHAVEINRLHAEEGYPYSSKNIKCHMH